MKKQHFYNNMYFPVYPHLFITYKGYHNNGTISILWREFFKREKVYRKVRILVNGEVSLSGHHLPGPQKRPGVTASGKSRKRYWDNRNDRRYLSHPKPQAPAQKSKTRSRFAQSGAAENEMMGGLSCGGMGLEDLHCGSAGKASGTICAISGCWMWCCPCWR